MSIRIPLTGARHGSSKRPVSAFPAGPLGRALAVVAGGAILLAGLFVSVFVAGVLLVVGTVAGGWFWWKTRDLRRQLGEQLARVRREQAAGRGPADPGLDRGADVLDGDFIREAEPAQSVRAAHPGSRTTR